MVREFYATETKKWRPPKKPMTVEALMDTYISIHGNDNVERITGG
jgi:hypothetical protein